VISIDGVGGVSESNSSFVPTAPVPKYGYFTARYMARLNFLQGGFAFKICDSLISCAAHKK
jgi:hypothetical protein